MPPRVLASGPKPCGGNNIKTLEQQKSFRAHTTLLASMCHAMPFSARALKKNIFFDVDIVVKKQIEMWLIVVCTLTESEYLSLLVSQTFFSYCFCILREFVKVFERKV